MNHQNQQPALRKDETSDLPVSSGNDRERAKKGRGAGGTPKRYDRYDEIYPRRHRREWAPKAPGLQHDLHSIYDTTVSLSYVRLHLGNSSPTTADFNLM